MECEVRRPEHYYRPVPQLTTLRTAISSIDHCGGFPEKRSPNGQWTSCQLPQSTNMTAAKLIPPLVATIAAIWIIAIAILSVQNATLVSLKFLGLQSIQLPVGLILAASVGVGAIGGAIAIVVLPQRSNRP
jgi:uncharacterized integral membrane protein